MKHAQLTRHIPHSSSHAFTQLGGRVAKAGKARQRKNKVRTSFLNTGQLARHYPRFIVAGEVAGSSDKFGGMGAMVTHPAHIWKLTPGAKNCNMQHGLPSVESAEMWKPFVNNKRDFIIGRERKPPDTDASFALGRNPNRQNTADRGVDADRIQTHVQAEPVAEDPDCHDIWKNRRNRKAC